MGFKKQEKKRIEGEAFLFYYTSNKTGKIKYGFDKVLGGRRIEKSGFNTKKQAREYLYRLIGTFNQSPETILNPKIKLSDLCEKWMEDQKRRNRSKSHIQKCELVLREFKKLTGNIQIDTITESHLSTYIDKMQQKLKPSTIEIHMRILKSCLNSARRFYPKLLWNPPSLPVSIPRQERIEPEVRVEDIEAIIEALQTLKIGHHQNRYRASDVADMVLLSSHTALRLGEVISLKWSNVNLIPGVKFPHGRLQFISFKTRQFSQLSLTRQASEVLKRRFETKTNNQERIFDWGISHASMIVRVEEIFKAGCKKAGITYGRDIEGGIRFHSLRHFVARSLLDRGVDLATVGAYGRWNQKSMILLYGKATPSSIDVSRKIIEDMFSNPGSNEESEKRKA